MLTRDEAQKLARKVIGLSTFPDCQVTITSQEQAYTRFANNGITTASFSLRHNISVATTRDGRTGVYATNDLDDASLRAPSRRPRNWQASRLRIRSAWIPSARRNFPQPTISMSARRSRDLRK